MFRRAAHFLIVVGVCGHLLGERAPQKRKKKQCGLHIGATCPDSPLTKDRRECPFQHFQFFVPASVVGTDKRAVLRPLKAHSQNTDLTPEHNPQQEQEVEQDDLAASQVIKVSWVRGCLLFLLSVDLEPATFNSLLLMFLLVTLFSAT